MVKTFNRGRVKIKRYSKLGKVYCNPMAKDWIQQIN